MLPRIRRGDSWVSPWSSLCVDPFRVPWCRNPEVGRTHLQERACSCTKCTTPQTTICVHEEAVPRTCQMHGQNGLESEVGSARPSSRGWRHSCNHSILQACSPSAGTQGTEVAKWLKKALGSQCGSSCCNDGQVNHWESSPTFSVWRWLGT